MANHLRSIMLVDPDRQELERLLRASTTPAGLSRRARAVLLMAEVCPALRSLGVSDTPWCR